MRDRKATRRRLTIEQETFLLTGTSLIPGLRGETDRDVERRLFTTSEAASEAWCGHRAALMAEYPTAGVRAYGWWVYERGCDVPPAASQADLLRDLGVLTELEEAQLEAWRRMVPEPPADLSLDHSVVDLTIATEDHTYVTAEPTPAAGRTDAPEVPGGHSDAERPDAPEPRVDGAEAPSITAPEHERADAPAPPGRPLHGAREDDMKLLPWPLQNGRNPHEGWL